MANDSSIKTGSLLNDFKLFHLRDRSNLKFEYHYHDFHKVIIFISGKVVYNVEGKAYTLNPWDILLVPCNQVHKPVIDPMEEYERIVIWINNLFLQQHSNNDYNLLNCFEMAVQKNSHIIRAGASTINSLKLILNSLEHEAKSKKFGAGILCNSLFIQLMVQLNRLFITPDKNVDNIDVEYDEQIQSIIRYINSDLSALLTVDSLANRFYINKYYLMHKFKAKTGYTLHNYIGSKRLLKSCELIKSGMTAADAATECGFNDYSSYVRAFTKMFGASPTNYYKLLKSNGSCSIIEG